MQQPPVGIDLGTTYSAIAIVNSAGVPEIIPNAEGERTTASAVYFQDARTSLIGQIAVEQSESQPERVARWMKRHMGDADWRFSCVGQSLSAVDLSALVLRRVVQDAALIVGPVRDVVITVPAYFDEFRRKATMDAGRLAGLNVLRIINEPTAAALAYASSGRVTGRCLVFDFGGGTFDVSIVKIASASDVTVIATGGDHRLGGHDLDRALADELGRRFEADKRIPLVPPGDRGQDARLMNRAEDVKRALSRLQEKRGEMLARGAQTVSTNITRRDFESIIAPLLSRTEMLVDATLDDAGLRTTDIDHVILVGGSTRIPAVAEMLERKFGKPATTGVSPDEAVALGAAVQCALLMARGGLEGRMAPEVRSKFADSKCTDVTGHSYGTLYLDVEQNPPRQRNSILIPRNSSIPCSRTNTFYTVHEDQEKIELTITQGDDDDPEFVNVVIRDEMRIPKGHGDAGREIRVEYSYDANGRMLAVFRHPASGQERRFDLDTAVKRHESGSTGSVPAPQADRDWFDDLEVA